MSPDTGHGCFLIIVMIIGGFYAAVYLLSCLAGSCPQ